MDHQTYLFTEATCHLILAGSTHRLTRFVRKLMEPPKAIPIIRQMKWHLQ